jgi:4-hydroxybenzoate polyprenyltransferase
LKKALHLFHQLHFDIALGAVGSSFWIGRLLDLSLSLILAATLGLAVWVIYLSDHLLDALRYAGQNANRYGFYKRNRKVLLFAIVFGLLMGMVLAIQLPIYFLYYGLIMGGMVMIYLGAVQLFPLFSRSFKEVWVAILYAGGICLPYIYEADLNRLWLLWVWFFLLVLCTLFMYSIIEEKEDLNMGLPSLAQSIGSKKLFFIHDILLVLASILLLYGLITMQVLPWFIPAITMFALTLILRLQPKALDKRHRYLGEIIFLLPWAGVLL